MENTTTKYEDNKLKTDDELKLQHEEGNETKLINELITPKLNNGDSSKTDINKFIQQEIEHVNICIKDIPSKESSSIVDDSKEENILKEQQNNKDIHKQENESTISDTKSEYITNEETFSQNDKTSNEDNETVNNNQEKETSYTKEEEPVADGSTSNKESKKIDEWEDILGSGCILKKTIAAGAENSRPQRSDICTVNYKCTLEDGTLVESEEYATIQLGDLEIIQGVDLAVALMDIGEKCLLRIEPRLAYGSEGLDNRVPADTAVLYELELVYAQPEKDIANLTINERKEKGDMKKKRGNWWYARGENTFAIQCYRRALDYLDEVEGGISEPLPDNDDPVQRELTDAALQSLMEDRINVSNNMAAAQLKLGAHDAALQSLQTVLRCQPNNVKALYRKAKILRDKNEIQQALSCLNKARQLAPENLTILKEIQEIYVILKKHKDYEKELARRMFSGPETNQSKKGNSDSKNKSYIWATVVLSIAAGIAGVAAWRFKFS